MINNSLVLIRVSGARSGRLPASGSTTLNGQKVGTFWEYVYVSTGSADENTQTKARN